MTRPTTIEKNNAIGNVLTFDEEGQIKMSLYAKHDEAAEIIKINARKMDVHFFFCLHDEAFFSFSPQYAKTLAPGKSFLIYDPSRDVPIGLSGEGDCKVIHLQTTIDYLHELFVSDAPEMAFLSMESRDRKYYEERDIPANLFAPLQQLYSTRLSAQAQRLFLKGKLYEILACYFSFENSVDTESCPFLKDEDSVKRVKKAKEILINAYTNPPSLNELSRMVGLNELKLKTGFKEVYGNTVYGFVLDYKLETARAMLESRQHKINEIAFHIGYSNPSHFISAFKKKYGITPKQYTKENI
ncbi:MAG: AraC family transcriptional regulator [Cryomorphaceae bacterium]|nr:AraC family transcriptional regulator [Cryomorphaceae bacterium]